MNGVRAVRAGFSLIEIVVAVTIMAIIIGLVAPNVMRWWERSRVKATKIALKNVEEAIEMYHGDTGQYPTTLNDLFTRPADEKAAKRYEGPYLKKAEYPTDGWGVDLVYTVSPKGTQPPYELYSWGPNHEGSPSEEWVHARDI